MTPPGAAAEPSEPIGRATLLDDVATLLRHERWVTLVGPAGIGKTRLCLELRRRVAGDPDERGDGTHLCELVDIGSVASLAEAIARTLSLEISDPESLGRALAGAGRCLVVLDHLEPTVVPPERWLRDAPEARFLVTSRRRLGVPGEVAVEVGPLDVPRTDVREAVLSSSAVRLLAAHAGLPWVEGDLPAAAALVRGLGGNPLAIELVAAWTSRFCPREIVAALADGGATAVPRALAWSWSLLTPDDQTPLARLSVLPATFDEAAARAVAGPGLDLPRLVATSLVRTFVEPRLGESRFALYDAVRTFVAEQLSADGRAAARRALATHYGATAAHLVATLERRHASRDATRRAIEVPNFLVALEHGEPAAAAAAGLALEPDLTTKGRYEEGLSIADRTLQAATMSGDLALLARATSMRGEVHRRRSLPLSRADHEAAASLAIEGPLLTARLSRCLGVVQRDLGDFTAAEASLLRAAEVLRTTTAPREVAFTELALATLRRRQDRPDLGVVHATNALGTAREAEDRLLEARALVTLGLLRDDAGELEPALALIEEAIPVLRGQGDRWTEEIAWNAAGLLHAELGRPDEARACYEEAITICEDAGFDAGLSCVTGNLGWLELGAGRVDRAALRFRQSIARAREVGYHFAEAIYGASLGALEASRDRIDDATSCFASAWEAAAACPSPGLRQAVATLEGFLDLAASRSATSADDPARAELHVTRARERLAEARATRRADGDLRTAVRALERALGHSDVPGAKAPRSLRLVREERTALLGDVQVALARHPSLWRMLVCIARAIHPVTVDALFAAGWPGERIGRRAARNRVHVGLSTLRRLGLSGVLVSSDDGYRIAPHVECREISREGREADR